MAWTKTIQGFTQTQERPLTMPSVVYQTALTICQLCRTLPIGTNLGIVYLLWAIITGKLLNSRGSLFPALLDAGFTDRQARQSEASLREGKFEIDRIIREHNKIIKLHKKAEKIIINEHTPLLLDWVGFYRPNLKGCVTKHFQSAAGKALPAIELGMIARPYQVEYDVINKGVETKKVRKFPVLIGLVRGGETVELLQAGSKKMRASDVLIVDRQVKVTHLHQAGVKRFVVRGAIDMTARTEQNAPYCGHGPHPKQGSIVRPLARQYKDNVIEATKADSEETFRFQGRILKVQYFRNLVVKDCPLVFHVVVVHDPKYTKPWVLVTDLTDCGEVIFHLYRSRWKVEQIPQTGKQLLGGHRSFVHSEEIRYRLPELILFAASLSLYLSAITPAVARVFWDKNPDRTAGRFCRGLSGCAFPALPQDILADLPEKTIAPLATLTAFPVRVRNKRSVFAHLPVGVAAHRRQKKAEKIPAISGN